MSKKVFIRPGTPDDDNRDYLPERIKGSDIVVNENGNNSQPYPERLREYRAVLDEDGRIVNDPNAGIAGVWYEYVPESFDPAKKTPLVVSLHGGLMTGWGQCIYSSWSILAEREGFLCVFPNGYTNPILADADVPHARWDEAAAPRRAGDSRPRAHHRGKHRLQFPIAVDSAHGRKISCGQGTYLYAGHVQR